MPGSAKLEVWPDCAVLGCPNRCCRALDSIFCFPHTPGNVWVKRMKIAARDAKPGSENERLTDE